MKGPETEKAESRRSRENFFTKYCSGVGLDIGFRGQAGQDASPVVPNAIGVDRDYPGYDGKILPFPAASQDFVYSSHCLEHVKEPLATIQEWYRVVKVGGYLVLTVPHRDLYEKRMTRPSKWNAGHKRFYTPASLLVEIEGSLKANSYRVRYMQDCDEGYDYTIGPDQHAAGEYQIECVIQRLAAPLWSIYADQP